MNLAEMRTDYRRGKLRREDLNPDPIAQFELWLEEASAAKTIEPTAMSLPPLGLTAAHEFELYCLKAWTLAGSFSSPIWKAAKRAKSPRTLTSRSCFPGSRWSAR
jgi:hypothetical protein